MSRKEVKRYDKSSEFEDDSIWTNARWIGNYRMERLRNCGDRKFHGNFIPEIPYQMIRRYTVEGDWVLDPMAGGGTTRDVAKILNRNCDMFDISPVRNDIEYGDAALLELNKMYPLIILHPPYFNIVKFSNEKEDVSNLKTITEFLDQMSAIFSQLDKFLMLNGHFCLVCGNIYHEKEEHPLGFYLSEIIRKSLGWKRKAIIFKDYGETKGGKVSNPKNQRLMRYRYLKYGLWGISGDYIFVFRKEE